MLQVPLAQPETYGQRLCQVLHKLHMHQGTMPQTLWPPQAATNPWPSLGVNLNGFHQTATCIGRIHSDPATCGQTNSPVTVHTYPHHDRCSPATLTILNPHILEPQC